MKAHSTLHSGCLLAKTNDMNFTALVKLNQNIINAYLGSAIEFQSSLENFRRRCALNVIDVYNARHNVIPCTCSKIHESAFYLDVHSCLLAVFFNIYWIRGKMYQAQIKYRSKVNAEKTMENLEDAVEQYSVSAHRGQPLLRRVPLTSLLP